MIQGSSADITKYAAILFFSWLIKEDLVFKVKIINTVHDEILLEAKDDIIEKATNVLLDCMAKAGKPFCPIVPLTAKADIGKHWIH